MTAEDGAGGLDDLFSARDEPRVEPVEEGAARKPSMLLRLLRNALLVAVATTVTVAVLRAADTSVSILLVVCAFTGLRLILLAVGRVAAPKPPRRAAGSGRAGAGEAPDSLTEAVRRWEKTLERAHSESEHWSRNVLPVLAELTDERLRLRHGITRSTDPRRARELLGDPLWAALHDSGRRSPKSRDLETYVDVLERL